MPDAETAYLFRHAVLRDAARNLHLPSDRARLHGLALEILEALPGIALDALAAELADHAAAAREDLERGPQFTRLQAAEIRHVLTAARAAERDWHLDSAQGFWQRVMQLGPEASVAEEATVGQVRCIRLLGHPQQAYDFARQALAGKAESDCLALRVEFGKTVSNCGDAADSVAILRAALAQDGLTDQLRRVARVNLVTSLRNVGTPSEAHEELKPAIHECSEANDLTNLGYALLQLVDVLDDLGDRDGSKIAEAELWQLLDQQPNVGLETNACINLGMFRYRHGHLDEAERLLRRALSVTEASGQRQQWATASANLGVLLMARQRHEDAIVVLQQTQQIAREVGSLRLEHGVIANIATALGESGRIPEAAQMFRQALVLARKADDPRMVGRNLSNLAYALQALGEHEEARVHLAEALESLARGGASDTVDGMRINVNLALVLQSLGRLTEAIAIVNQADSIAGRLGIDASHGNPFTRAHWEQIQKLKKELGA